MAINILDSMIINRISAGEVVESPFSIVKELIDNSLDAGATKISVSIKNGGIDEIVVKDNGKGIDYDDIVKAFLPHATSKIKSIEDLDSISTLGFRGEALASISNVSQTTLSTKTANSEIGYSIDVFGGKFGDVQASTSEQGTTIKVANLFFNTPARRKFLKKPKQEETQITNIISRYILANPQINFKYVVDGKTIYQTRGNTLLDAISCVYGFETTQNIMPISGCVGNIKISGYVSKLGFSKPNTTYQTLMINSRYVIDEIVSKAAYMAFDEYLMPRQFPFYVLNLTIPNVDVDVNVHPSKMNVKFSSPSKIYDLVFSSIRSAIFNFLHPSKSTQSEPKKNEDLKENLIKTDLNSLQEISIDPVEYTPSKKNIVLKQEEFEPITMFEVKTKINNAPSKTQEIKVENKEEKQNNEQLLKTTETEDETKDFVNIRDLSDYKIIGEIFNEFIILEKGENMILLDFHAGHERLNYDKFSKMVDDRDIVLQDLLVPYVQEMSEQEVEFILSLKDNLTELGFDIDAFGNKKIIINTVPMQLKDINLKGFVDDLLHDMKNLKPSMNNEIKHYLMQKACKSSVKSGMSLTEHEIKELLKNLDEKNPVLLCPHGRPVITIVSKGQIEKWFKRIV